MAMHRLKNDVLDLSPSAAVLQIGINDLKVIGVLPDRAEWIIESVKNNLTRMAQTLQQNRIRVIILTIFPTASVEWFRRPLWSKEIDTAVRRVNDHIRGMESSAVTIIDCDALFLVDGGMDARYRLDTLHLNIAGYEALNGVLAPALERLFAGWPDRDTFTLP
jgi:lysophospholipase L1-like esterase